MGWFSNVTVSGSTQVSWNNRNSSTLTAHEKWGNETYFSLNDPLFWHRHLEKLYIDKVLWLRSELDIVYDLLVKHIPDHKMAEAEAQRKRIYKEKRKNDKDNLIQSGACFIKKFNQLLEETNVPDDVKRKYMSKVLHAIFFFGWIHKPQVKPEEFLKNCPQTFQERFPQPFAQYRTHLPTQTPYSILLDYMTEEIGVTDPDELMTHLKNVNEDMYKLSANNSGQLSQSTFCFIASVVARAYRDLYDTENHVVVFGASLSCRGKEAKLIMIDLSCIKTWHKAVASAVYNQGKGNATVSFNAVTSQAYQIKENGCIMKRPCKKCHEIFKNVTFDPPFEVSQDTSDTPWMYGNCAETEALSKLLWQYPDAAKGELSDSDRENIDKRLITKLASNNFLVNTLEYFQAE